MSGKPEAEAPLAFRFRRMAPRDLPEVMAIERLSFPNPWPESTFVGEIQNAGISHPIVAVGESDGRVAGYVIYWLIRDEAQINNVAVHPDARRRGVGEALLRRVLGDMKAAGARTVVLEVRVSNAAARRLYDKLGFRPIGVRKGYYMNPDEDACVLALALT